MKMNKKKTKIMCNEVARRRLRTGLMIDTEQLEEVTEYKYLGRLVTSGNEISKEIGKRITSGWRRSAEYSQFLKERISQSNFYSTNIPGVARLTGATSRSVLNSKIDEVIPQHQQVLGHAGVYGGKAKSKRYVLRHFLKVATEVDERTDSSKLFQREGAQELNDLFNLSINQSSKLL